MATAQRNKTRLFTQIGDSSDGEDDYTVRDDFVQELNEYKNKPEFNLKYHPNVNDKTFNFSTSCMLKEIGHQVLQNETVRVKYRKIKEKLVPIGKEYEELDKKLGRGWNTLVTKYYHEFGHDPITKKKHEEAFEKYFKLNETKINNECKDEVFKDWNDSIKGKLSIKDKILQRITYINLKDHPEESKNYNELNDSYYKDLLDHEKGKHYLQKIEDTSFMKTIGVLNFKIHEKFDELRRNITKPVNLNFNDTEPGSFLARLLSSQKLDKDLTTNCYLTQTKLDLNPYDKYIIHITGFTGYCTYEIKDLGSYNNIRNRSALTEWADIKNILKLYFRGELLDEGKKIFLFEWRYFIELIGVEIIRNSSALLTWPMFLDLLHNGYGLPDLVEKLPSAYKGAVNASCVISEKMNRPFYDCREVFSKDRQNKDVSDLAKRDEQIVNDWLIHQKVEPLQGGLIQFEVPAKVFYDLIDEWYNIQVDELNKPDKLVFQLPSLTNNQNVP